MKTLYIIGITVLHLWLLSIIMSRILHHLIKCAINNLGYLSWQVAGSMLNRKNILVDNS